MWTSTMPRPEAPAFRQRAWPAMPAPRGLLALGTVLALAAAGLIVARAPTTAIDPDLVRVIRAMAVIKGGFAAMALAACWLRLGQPASGWRGGAYVAGPALMAGGALALWSLQSVAALGLHLGLFGVLAAGLTDPAFFDGRHRRRT
ncbi:hypothetical protein [Methylobacterium sp. J-092]|uniref:hypothetical protein n=1 Tax=Methylobacterium sp. J-092 TaxID=2836667 RepID=UPI001FBA6D1A|nr:hypothetical protein [Methylobacterium sp. J-092]MCJ2007074.1 hypothetical protein [Methylobacterium sp. J-092]